MKNKKSMWVMGHLITPVEATPSFSLVLGETPPGMEGPPPHFHRTCQELFSVIDGEMTFFLDGKWLTLGPGEMIRLEKEQLHTFKNASDQPIRWVNVHYPGGFERVFAKMGIPASEPGAQQRSISRESVANIMQIVQDPANDFIVPMEENAP